MVKVKDKSKKPKRIKATSSTKNAWNRLEFSEFTHWTTRHKMEKLPSVKAKVLKASAETVEEAIAVSLALTLLQGEADQDIQSRFDAICEVQAEEFHTEFPDFKYVLGGRGKGSKNGMHKGDKIEEDPISPPEESAKSKKKNKSKK